MAITGFDRKAFEEVLRRTLSPTTPIRSVEYLRGRERKLEEIRRALVQPGRHIFIYGERGVGKTSLAQTAAYEHQTASIRPILRGCDPSSTFFGVARDLATRLLSVDPTMLKQSAQKKGGAGFAPYISGELQHSIERGRVPDLRSMNEAVEVVSFAADRHSKEPVVVIDEFERIKDPEQRALFADFIKQVGDQSSSLKLIFCGVGAALDELLDTHHSCYRYLTSMELERLAFPPRAEIMETASNALNISIENSTFYRIAMISGGFPHYVHLITEKLLWEVWEDENTIKNTQPSHYLAAIRAAVLDIEPKLKATYEKATLKYRDEYEAVLWAVADHHELKRRSTDIYESYRHLSLPKGMTHLRRDRFNARMNQLKKPSHAEILKGTRQGWYEFREAVLRGYVRLRAEARGVQVGADHPAEFRSPRAFCA